MSHAATNWAIQQRGLKPATKILLWHLSDRHNKDTKRCDPSQDLLAYDAEMSRATVNRHLDRLEAMALVRRIPRICPRTKKQLSTAYELSFDHKITVLQNETRPASQNEPRAVSQKTSKPCLNSDDSRVSICDTNPVSEPVREPCGPEADPQINDLPNGFLDQFIEAFPRIGSLEKTEAALLDAIASGVDPADILHGAKAYATEQKGNQPRYIAYSENWVSLSRWAQFAKKSRSVDPEAIARSWAKSIKEGATWVARHISAAAGRDLVARGLVTEAECKAVGIIL